MLKETTRFRLVSFWLLTTAGTLVLCAGVTKAAKSPVKRSRSEIEAVLAKAGKQTIGSGVKIVLLADVKDHGEDEHDYPLWQKRWALLLGGKNAVDPCVTQVNLYGPASGDYNEISAGQNGVQVTTAWEWPSEEQFKTADVIVAFCYLKWNAQRLKQIEEYLSRGGGFVVVHPASFTKPGPSQEVAKLLGVGGYKLYRHGLVELKIVDSNNSICLGLPQTIKFDDETYWPATPVVDIEVLATSDEKVGKDANDIKPQTIFWTHKFGKGRVFGCVPGHNNGTFDDPYFRIILLRGIAWAGNQSPYRFDSLVLRGASLKNEKE
jgi:type 1 glutamine amidotransferase